MAGKSRGAAGWWRERVARWRSSGLSVAEFCRRDRLSSPLFYVWRKRLKGGRGQGRRGTGRVPRLLPVQLVDPPGVLSVAAAARVLGGTGGVEIVLPRGVTVRAGTEIDEFRLRSVLRAVLAETGGC